jgi:hypothetical protein
MGRRRHEVHLLAAYREESNVASIVPKGKAGTVTKFRKGSEIRACHRFAVHSIHPLAAKKEGGRCRSRAAYREESNGC